MEQISIPVVAIPWITTTSLFNCTGQWTSGSGQGIESGTTTVCFTSTYPITKIQNPAHTQSSTSSVSAGQTFAYVIISTLSTAGISPVATKTSLPTNIASQKSPLTFSAPTSSTYNATVWTSVTTLNSLRIIQSTISPSPIYPEITLTSLPPNPSYSITTPYLNPTIDSSTSSSSSSHYSTFTSSSPPSIYSLSSPSTSTHTFTATTTIECAIQKTTDTRIGVTTGVLLVVVGLACFVCMVLLLSIRRDTIAILQKNWKKKNDRNDNSERRGGGIDEERGCRCGRTRYEMEGMGRPPEMEPGLDHGALIRYEMSAGDEVKGAGQSKT